MNIEIISSDQTEKWDDMVRSFEDYDVYYLNGYAEGFRVHGDGEPMLFYIEDDDCRAMNVVMKRVLLGIPDMKDSPVVRENFDICTPYGYGGFLVEGKMSRKMAEAYCELCAKNNIVSEFVRFNPMTNNQAECHDIYEIIPLGETVYIDLQDEEYVWGNFTSQNRNKIRKAQKEGVTIHTTDQPWIIDEFIEIYDSTMERDRAEYYYYFKRGYYDSIISGLQNHFQFFYAKKDDNIIAVSIILFANRRMHYHLSASRKEFQKYAPTNLLLYEAAKFGIDNGFKTFHLGGGVGSKEDSLYKFKKSFNKRENKRYCIGKKIYDYQKYNQLVKCRTDIKNENFFPKYRG